MVRKKILIASLIALAVIAGLILTKKPVDDYRFFSNIIGKPVVQGEVASNGAIAVAVNEKTININIHPNKLDSTEYIKKIVSRYFPPGKRDEIIKAVNDGCEAVKSNNHKDGAEIYRYTSETGNSIYIRTWSIYGGTVYILIRGV